MGTIFYGDDANPIDIDDRTLAHLKVVITTKLRRSESFTLSWQHRDDEPCGRSTIWLHSSIPLRFVFDEPKPVELNPAWISELARSANSSGGIQLMTETHGETAKVPNPPHPDLAVVEVQVNALTINRMTVSSRTTS